MFIRLSFVIAVLLLQPISVRAVLAHEPGPDGRCHFPFMARDTQGFCWMLDMQRLGHEEEYARMRAAGLTPPTPILPSQGLMHIPDHALSSMGQNSLKECLQRAQVGMTTEQQCRADYDKATRGSYVLEGTARTLPLIDPLLATGSDPKGAFCDKVIEMFANHIPFGESLGAMAKAYGVYDSIKKGFNPPSKPTTFREEVMEACHLR